MSLFSLNTYDLVVKQQLERQKADPIQRELTLIAKTLEASACHQQTSLSGISFVTKGCDAALERLQKLMKNPVTLRDEDMAKIVVALKTVKKLNASPTTNDVATALVEQISQHQKVKQNRAKKTAALS